MFLVLYRCSSRDIPTSCSRRSVTHNRIKFEFRNLLSKTENEPLFSSISHPVSWVLERERPCDSGSHCPFWIRDRPSWTFAFPFRNRRARRARRVDKKSIPAGLRNSKLSKDVCPFRILPLFTVFTTLKLKAVPYRSETLIRYWKCNKKISLENLLGSLRKGKELFFMWNLI